MRDVIGIIGLLIFIICGSCGLLISASIGLATFYVSFKPRFKEYEEQ